MPSRRRSSTTPWPGHRSIAATGPFGLVAALPGLGSGLAPGLVLAGLAEPGVALYTAMCPNGSRHPKRPECRSHWRSPEHDAEPQP